MCSSYVVVSCEVMDYRDTTLTSGCVFKCYQGVQRALGNHVPANPLLSQGISAYGFTSILSSRYSEGILYTLVAMSLIQWSIALEAV